MICGVPEYLLYESLLYASRTSTPQHSFWSYTCPETSTNEEIDATEPEKISKVTSRDAPRGLTAASYHLARDRQIANSLKLVTGRVLASRAAGREPGDVLAEYRVEWYLSTVWPLSLSLHWQNPQREPTIGIWLLNAEQE